MTAFAYEDDLVGRAHHRVQIPGLCGSLRRASHEGHLPGQSLPAVPVGGGGLIAGIAAYYKQLAPQTRIIGVEPFEADAMFRSLEAGRRVRLDTVGIFADGVAVQEVGDGIRVAAVDDPFGNKIGLIENPHFRLPNQ